MLRKTRKEIQKYNGLLNENSLLLERVSQLSALLQEQRLGEIRNESYGLAPFEEITTKVVLECIQVKLKNAILNDQIDKLQQLLKISDERWASRNRN